MFPLRHRDVLVFQEQAEEENLEDLLAANPALLESSDLVANNSRETNRGRRSRSSGARENRGEIADNNNNTNEVNRRRIIHRENERQRRQEMSNLFASLRSLLPLQPEKGKNYSTSDHIKEAISYIKTMEMKIKELEMQKDRLRNLSTSRSDDGGSSSCHTPNFVTVNNCVAVNPQRDGVEILINTMSAKEGAVFPLSSVLMELLTTGLDVVSCDVTQTNGKFLIRIGAELNDISSIDLSALQERLANAID